MVSGDRGDFNINIVFVVSSANLTKFELRYKVKNVLIYFLFYIYKQFLITNFV